MKIEIEVKAFGEVEVQGTAGAHKGVELIHVHELYKDTTLGEVEGSSL
ncbi:hypothetical protein ACFFGV_15365 [Pontibacillus salicampi]|uniref:Uncharacterized protein n=1 Tax=Pontibacillus salicampi TaxID=1449801 RepID=A0ABV6LRM1_9BACI